MIFKADKRYLLLPVDREAPKRELILRTEDGKIAADLQVCLSPDSGKLFPYDLRQYRGMTLKSNLDFTPTLTDELPPVLPELYRPRAHFSPRFGWMNDPNGLIYYEDRWHLFFQHNPVGTRWGNMHWGHAVSDDLMRWTEGETVLFPDENGYMYSGSAVEDTENLTGLKENEHNPLLLFYTASPNHGVMDAGKVYTQRLAYSVDGGHTFRKYPKTIVENIARANRDPKVIFCPEWGKWVMALYLEEDEYAILTSDNLLDWQIHQRFSMAGDNECPDFFPLQADGETYWVFCGAHGGYLVGRMDSGKFEPVQEIRRMQDGKCYAAQTYSGVADGRRIRFGWNKSGMGDGMSQGSMTTPHCLTLHRVGEALCLALQPAREVGAVCHSPVRGRDELTLQGGAHKITVTLPANGKSVITLGELKIEADPENGMVTSGELSGTMTGNTLEIIRDVHSVECWCGDFLLCIPFLSGDGALSVCCPGAEMQAWRMDGPFQTGREMVQ